GGMLWAVLRRLGVSQRRAAVLVTLVLVGYALVTGGRAPAMRAAVAACVLCGGMVFWRVVVPANTFALAWLVVVVLHPSDVFDQGCQLSFLGVAVLAWGCTPLFPDQFDPLEREIDRTRPWWLRLLRTQGAGLVKHYGVNVIAWACLVPLVVYHTGLFPPAALL